MSAPTHHRPVLGGMHLGEADQGVSHRSARACADPVLAEVDVLEVDLRSAAGGVEREDAGGLIAGDRRVEHRERAARAESYEYY